MREGHAAVCKHLCCALRVFFKSMQRESSFFALSKSQLKTQVVHWRICILKIDPEYRKEGGGLKGMGGDGKSAIRKQTRHRAVFSSPEADQPGQ